MPKTHIAIDFGTTNTATALVSGADVQIVVLPGLGREQPTEQLSLVPSAVECSDEPHRWGLFHWSQRRVSIGQAALSRNHDGCSPSFAAGFKRALAETPQRTALREETREYSVRQAAAMFLQTLLSAIKRRCRVRRIQSLTMTVPVDSYEAYRAELQQIARGLGVRHFRTLDEPVAAALGYGMRLDREKTVVVVDFGGGTLDFAAARLSPDSAGSGAAPVLAKHMVRLGGDDVDSWILAHLGLDLDGLPEWQQDARWEAMRVKERLSQDKEAEFRWRGICRHVSRADLVQILADHDLYKAVRAGCDEIRSQLAVAIDEVILVGGSTLLPGVAAEIDAAFRPAIVRHDEETLFTAVASGAARFASGIALDDFIYHDYCLAVQDPATQSVQYELLVPQRTRYPAAALTTRYYGDYAGMSEIGFHICEAGRLGQARILWQRGENGNDYWTPSTSEERASIVALNPDDAPVSLRPAGRGLSPRLRATYGLNADRWLCITVEDLLTHHTLRANDPLVRLR